MRVLLKRETLPLSELSSLLASPAGASPTSPEFETRRDARAGLFHVHLPKLEDAGLVSGNWTDGTVSLGHHPDIREGRLTIPLFEAVEQDAWDAVAAAHDTRRCHEVFVQLARSGPTLTLDRLAEELTASTARSVESARCGDDDRPERVAVRLHHLTLPRLDEVGLVSYDPDCHEVEYVGDRWFGLSELVDALEPDGHAATDPVSESVSQH